MTHLRKGLDLLPQLSESDNVDLHELEMQLALGPALMAIKGYSAPEIEPVYARARELCRQAGQPFQLFAATWGLWLYYQQGGQLKQARELTEEVLAVAEQQDDPALLLQAHHAAWATFHRLGELPACRHHAEQGVMLYDVEQHSAPLLPLRRPRSGGVRTDPCRHSFYGVSATRTRRWNGLSRHSVSVNSCHTLSAHTDALFGAGAGLPVLQGIPISSGPI